MLEGALESMVEAEAARRARYKALIREYDPRDDDSVAAATQRVLEVMLRDAVEDEGQMSGVERLRAVTSIMLDELPSDLLSTVNSYLQRVATDIELHDVGPGLDVVDLTSRADDLVARLPTLQALIEAAGHHDEAAAVGRYTEAEDQLDRSLQEVQQFVSDARAEVVRNRRRLLRARLLRSAVRVGASLAVALTAWVVGEAVGGSVWVGFALALIWFIVVDLLVERFFLEVALDACERRILRKASLEICDVLAEIDRKLVTYST
jgi:hypothetical protein